MWGGVGGTCQNRLWRGIQFLTIELYTSFISQLSEVVNLHNIDCSFMSFLQYKISELIRPLFFPVDIYRRCCKLNFGPLHGSGELQDKTCKKVQFSCCLTFLPTAMLYELRKNYGCRNRNNRGLAFFIKITDRFVQKCGDSKYCNFPNSKLRHDMDIYLQVLQTFQNTAVFKTIFKNIFCQWVNQSICKLGNILFRKLHY